MNIGLWRKRHSDGSFFADHSRTIVRAPYLLVEGPLQKYEGVIHVQARRIEPIQMTARAASSHDF